jgi:cellulose synthase/poly-beta-1,6-N-acetylglucosamine synthase-like glycosyltransferase
VRKAKNKFVAVVDGDSFLTKDSILNAMKYFDEDEVAGVTSRILVKKRETIFERWQDIEFKVVALTRKIKEGLNLVDVTPGPLSIYRRDILLKVGLFDEKNLTEDIEIAWRLLNKGYRINMAYDSVVYTNYPEKFSTWLKQRVRWQIGWMQTVKKYSSSIFKNHPVGTFMLPVGLLSLLFQIVGVGLLFYIFGNSFLTLFFYFKYSLALGSTPNILQIQSFPSMYVFYGMILFTLGAVFSIYTVRLYKHEHKLLDFISFLVVYIYLFIPVTIYSLFRSISPGNSWLTK